VLQRLGSVKQLIVIARSSSFSFIGKQVDAREIGQRLAARYLVEGTLQRADDRIRVTAQLIDAQTGEQLRSLSFDRRLHDIFDLQDDIAGQVAAALQVQLLGADLNRVDRSHTTSLNVYLHYLDAVASMNRWTVKDAEHGAAELEQAVKIDPTFALAYAELARARWLIRFLRASRDKGGNSESLPLVNKALALDPNLGEAYAIRGVLQSDPKAAESDFRKALELAPNYGPAYEFYAEALHDDLQRPEEALAMIERAILIDPVAPRNLYMKGLYLSLDKDQDTEAEQWFLRALAVGPDFPPANARLAELRWSRGEVAEAVKLIERAMRADPQAYWIREIACSLYLDLGDRRAAGSVAVGLPAESQAAVVLASYDNHLRQAPVHRSDLIIGAWPLDFAYWVAVDAAARESGTVAPTIDWLSKEVRFKVNPMGIRLADDIDFAAAFTLADLYKAHKDTAAFTHLLDALKAWVEINDTPPGLGHATIEMLVGHPAAALDFLAAEIRRQHLGVWWTLERNPLWAELRHDPRFVAEIALERERVAKQRKMVDAMRASGEIPRRGGL